MQQRVSVSTQNQALCVLLFLYKLRGAPRDGGFAASPAANRAEEAKQKHIALTQKRIAC